MGLELRIDFIMIIYDSATAIAFAREIYEAGNVEDVYRKDGPILPAIHIAHALLSITRQYKGIIFQWTPSHTDELFDPWVWGNDKADKLCKLVR